MDVSSDPLFSLSKFDSDVGSAALVAISATHGRGADSLQPGALINEARFYKQVVDIDILVLLRRIRDGGLHDFFNLARGFRLVRKLQRHQCLIHVLAANQIHDQPRLLRRHPDKSACGFALHINSLSDPQEPLHHHPTEVPQGRQPCPSHQQHYDL